MSTDTFRAPEGSVTPMFPPEFHKKEITAEYVDQIDQAIGKEIGWIIGGIPVYPKEHIHNAREKGGEYFPDSGQITVNDDDLEIHYPHEKLHWLSRHKRREYELYSQPAETILTGSKVEISQRNEVSLRWLSEAVISETTQRVLAEAQVIRRPLVKYSQDLGSVINRYVGGWESANVRRVGDYYKTDAYSQLYGDLFRPLVLRMAEFLSTESGRALYNSVRDTHKLPAYSSSENADQLGEIAVKVFQVGEFSLNNSFLYQMLDQMLGRGKLKELVQASITYDTLSGLKLAGDPRVGTEKLEALKKELLAIIEG